MEKIMQQIFFLAYKYKDFFKQKNLKTSKIIN